MFFRPGPIYRLFYREAIFRVITDEQVVYLTFDDGPDPVSTAPLLKILDRHCIKAIFFCTGNNAMSHPELIEKIKSDGHIIGNHGFYHKDGLFTSGRRYREDIIRAAPLTSENLFRPPYGRMRSGQYIQIRKNFRIIMWDLMAYDFDKKFGSKKSLEILLSKIRPGSIIVLHDSQFGTTLDFIDDFLSMAIKKGYRFGAPELLLKQNS